MTQLFTLDATELREKLRGYKAFEKTKAIMQEYKQEIEAVEKQEDEIRKQISQLEKTQEQTKSDQNGAEPSDFLHLKQLEKDNDRDIENLKELLQETQEKITQIKLRYAYPVKEAVQADNSQLVHDFFDDVTESLNHLKYDLLSELSEGNKAIRSQLDEDTLIGDVIADSTVQERKPRVKSTQLKPHLHFQSSLSYQLQENELRQAVQKGTIFMPGADQIAKQKGANK